MLRTGSPSDDNTRDDAKRSHALSIIVPLTFSKVQVRMTSFSLVPSTKENGEEALFEWNRAGPE